MQNDPGKCQEHLLNSKMRLNKSKAVLDLENWAHDKYERGCDKINRNPRRVRERAGDTLM